MLDDLDRTVSFYSVALSCLVRDRRSVNKKLVEENNEQTKLIKERIYALSSLLWVSLCKTICLTFQNVFVKSQIVLHVRLDKISSMNTRYALGQKAFTVWYNDLCLRLRRCHKL